MEAVSCPSCQYLALMKSLICPCLQVKVARSPQRYVAYMYMKEEWIDIVFIKPDSIEACNVACQEPSKLAYLLLGIKLKGGEG